MEEPVSSVITLLATLAVAAWIFLLLRKEDVRFKRFAWGVALSGVSLYAAYLCFRIVDWGEVTYVKGTVTDVWKTTVASNGSGSDGLYLSQVRAGEQQLVVAGSKSIGDKVCVRVQKGRFTGGLSLENVDRENCSAD